MDTPTITIEITDDDTELSEIEWLNVSFSNSVFEYLHDSKEDSYTISEGEPFSEI